MGRNSICWPDMEPEKTFDQKMKAGANTDNGIAESMPLREEYERPWSKQIHKTTRGNDDANI